MPPPTGKRGRPALGTIRSLLRRLDANRDDVLRFASDFRVPFSNNEAERAIRMVKLQQKVSGSWRSWESAEAFMEEYEDGHFNDFRTLEESMR